MRDLENIGSNGRRKEIIIPDASPLIYLAKMDLLDLLADMYEHILITDVVWIETTRRAGKIEDATRILEWGEKLQKNMPERFVIVETPIGLGLQAGMKRDPDYRLRDGGETSIMSFIQELSHSLPKYEKENIHPEILYENGKVPKMVELLDMRVTTLLTSIFLMNATQGGYLKMERPHIEEIAKEKKAFFNLQGTVHHNQAALVSFVKKEDGLKSVSFVLSNYLEGRDVASKVDALKQECWTEKDTDAFLEREKKLAEYGNQWGGSSKKQKLLAETRDLTEKAKYHRSQDAELDRKLSQESRKIKKDMERGRYD